MSESKTNPYRVKLDVLPRTVAIVFHDPIPRGEYNLVVSTRCGDGRDYALRRIGHPITVPVSPLVSAPMRFFGIIPTNERERRKSDNGIGD